MTTESAPHESPEDAVTLLVTRRRRVPQLAAQPTVAVITTVLGATGGDRWLFLLEDRWSALGVRVTHLHVTGAVRDVPPLPPASVRVVQGSQADKRARADMGRVVRCALREIRAADVVLLEPQGHSAPLAFFLSKLTGRPTVIYSQGIADVSFRIWEPNRLHRALVRFMWRHVDVVMGVSPASVDAALRQRVAPEKLVEVRTGVDVDAIRGRATNSANEVARGTRPLIVGCGVVSAHKGFDRTVLAVAELRDRGMAVDLVIIGPPGDDFDRVSDLVRSHDLADRVTLITREVDAVSYIAQADAFVHAARYEPVGLVLLEALCVGTPVIAVDEVAGGPRLVVKDGDYGRLLPPEASPVALADAIQQHLECPEALKTRAEAAEDYLRADFSVVRAAEVSAEVFRRLAKTGDVAIATETGVPRPRRQFPRVTGQRGTEGRG
jgi:glycosyltransferase involved in cell wall biosynthesis